MDLAEKCARVLSAANHPRNPGPDPSLLSQLELRPIRSQAQFEAYEKIAGLLMAEIQKNPGEQDPRDALEVIGVLLRDYEAKNHEPIKASAAEMLRYMMEVNDWNQSQIAEEVGVPRQEISRALAEGATFPFPLAKKLAERFGQPLSLYVD